jgi:hypothetical protein
MVCKCSSDSFQSKASTFANPVEEEGHLQNSTVVECNRMRCDISSRPISDQMLPKQAFRSSFVASKATVKAWLGDQDIALIECISMESDILSIPISDQMLLKQAFRSSVATKKAAAKAWLSDRKTADGPKAFLESDPLQQLPGTADMACHLVLSWPDNYAG